MKEKMILAGVELTGDRRIGSQLKLNLDKPDEYIEIPIYPDKEEKEHINPDDVIRARMEEVWEK